MARHHASRHAAHHKARRKAVKKKHAAVKHAHDSHVGHKGEHVRTVNAPKAW